MSLWSWDELEKRFLACATSKDRELSAYFETYLRFHQDDNDVRRYYQDRVREAELRKRTGDPHHHPKSADGIDQGCITLGAEIRTGVPYRVELRRTGEMLNAPSINMAAFGPVGSGKTNFLAYVTLQALPLCRILVFARNASFRKRIPEALRDQFTVVQLEELKVCPTRPSYLDSNASPKAVQEETNKSTHWFCESFGNRFQRHDSLLLLHQGVELLFDDLGTFDSSKSHAQREWSGFDDIFKLFNSRAYRARLGGKSLHEESLTLVLKNFALNGQGVLDTRKGMVIHELLDSTNLVIETSSYTPEDASFLVELLLGQLWLRQQYTKTSTPELTYLVVLDDLQDAMLDCGAVHRLIRISRHAGFSFLLAPQNIGALSNDVLGNCQTFVLVGPQTSQRDITISMGVMGLSFKDDMTAELQKGEPGRAIARQPFAKYRAPTIIRIPLFPEIEYSEDERRQRASAWLESHATTTPTPPIPAPVAQAAQPSAPDDFRERVRTFVTSANNEWFEGHEFHFFKAGITDGSDKESLLRHAQALGWIHAENVGVVGLNGKRIQLAQITNLARQQLNLAEPESFKRTRGKHGTRYYQHQLTTLLGAVPGIASVEVEGLLGPNLKRVDVLGRLQNGKAVCIEFASVANADYEPENARVLKDAGEQIAKYVIVAETGRTRDKLRKTVAKLDARISVISFYDAVQQPSLLAPESLKINTPSHD